MKLRALSHELAEKAREELNEDPKRLEDGITHLKEWLSKQPHIRARTDDQWLAIFLRGSKFIMEKAKQKLDLYYTLRTTEPSMFNTLPSIEFFNEIMDLGAIVILPQPSGPAEPVVSIYRPGVYDPQKYNIIDMMKCSMIVQKIILYESDNFVIAGVRSIMDMQNCSMAHFVQMTPSLMRKMSVYMQDAAPIRLKGSHYVNTIPGFETIFNLFKTFLNEKNKSRLFVHNKNFEEMYKYVSQDILPSEYGGTAGPIKSISEYWKQKVKEYWPWLQEDLQYCTDESKRPGNPKTAEDIFGADGSFRQLQFD